MRLQTIVMTGVLFTACDVPVTPEIPFTPTKTGQAACESAGGSWSDFKTKQGLMAEICCHPAPEQVVFASALQR